jgi:UDP-3-O-[3-hydroxymyristoyl] glucosamine N-acyltransferase
VGELTLADLAKQCDCVVQGDSSTLVRHVATIQAAQPGSISFLANSKYKKFLSKTLASAVIIHPDLKDECSVPALLHPNPYVTYAKVAALLFPVTLSGCGVHPSAVVSDSATISASAQICANSFIGEHVTIGDHVYIGPNCVVEEGCSIGENTHLLANVSLRPGTIIGLRGIIHPGAVLGADGFGIAMDAGQWLKIPQLGRVVLGDDVEVGANTTIDRGAIDDTVINNGVKLDNQIQIAHNVEIGEHTAIAGCTAVAGSTKIGAYCTIAGAVGIVGHLTIADKVHVTAMTLVTKSITKSGSYSSGTPMLPTEDWHKSAVRFKQLDALARKVARLFKKQLL